MNRKLTLIFGVGYLVIMGAIIISIIYLSDNPNIDSILFFIYSILAILGASLSTLSFRYDNNKETKLYRFFSKINKVMRVLVVIAIVLLGFVYIMPLLQPNDGVIRENSFEPYVAIMLFLSICGSIFLFSLLSLYPIISYTKTLSN